MLRYTLQKNVTKRWQKRNLRETLKKFHLVKKVTKLKRDMVPKNKNQKDIEVRVDKLDL